MSRGHIKEGDMVFVHFRNAGEPLCLNDVEVLHTPQDTGDSWIFKEKYIGTIYYVSEGCTIKKRKR